MISITLSFVGFFARSSVSWMSVSLMKSCMVSSSCLCQDRFDVNLRQCSELACQGPDIVGGAVNDECNDVNPFRFIGNTHTADDAIAVLGQYFIHLHRCLFSLMDDNTHNTDSP